MRIGSIDGSGSSHSTQTLHASYLVRSDSGVQKTIDWIKGKMQTLNEDSAEYRYYELQLENQEIELKYRHEHPEINPMTQSGAAALYAMIHADADSQRIDAEIKAICQTHPECTHWGFQLFI
jgi:hypothetical protein